VAIKPLYDKLVVKRAEARTQTESGIHLPGKEDAPQEGEVLSVGDGIWLDSGVMRPNIVKEGDRVLFGRYAGVNVDVDGEELLILREDDILGIVH
jgi:chaperonin GroES